MKRFLLLAVLCMVIFTGCEEPITPIESNINSPNWIIGTYQASDYESFVFTDDNIISTSFNYVSNYKKLIEKYSQFFIFQTESKIVDGKNVFILTEITSTTVKNITFTDVGNNQISLIRDYGDYEITPTIYTKL